MGHSAVSKNALESRLISMSAADRAKLRKTLEERKHKAAPQSADRFDPAPAGPYGLSRTQRRLWVMSQFGAESSAAYNMMSAFLYPNGLDAEVLQDAWRALLSRHEILRSRFVNTGNDIVQEPWDAAGWRMTNVVLPCAEGTEAALRGVAEKEGARAFDLQNDRLVRVIHCTFDSATSECGLVIVIHHAICDGLSIPILASELDALYRAGTGQAPDLAAPRNQYRDYVAWERRNADEEAAHAAYWHAVFAGHPDPIPLPADFPRPPVQSFDGASAVRTIRAPTVAAFERRCSARRCTLYMGVLSVTQILLARWSGHTDIVIGTPAAGRTHPAADGMVGPFVNTLALRRTILLAESFDTHLESVRRGVIESFEHQGYAFDRLVENLGIAPDSSRSPLFDVMLGLNEEAAVELVLAGQTPRRVNTRATLSKVDLTFHVEKQRDGSLALELEYSRALFGPVRMERMARAWCELFERFAGGDESPVGMVPLMPPADRHAIVAGFNRSSRPYPAESTITAEFRRQVARAPDAVAVHSGDRQLTYGELDRQSDALAAWLCRGMHPEPRVPLGIMMDRSDTMVVGLLGILKAGAAYMPLALETPPERLLYLLGNARVRCVLTDKKGLKLLRGWSGTAMDLHDLLRTMPEGRAPELAQEPASLAYVIYTSGSTGQPKGTLVEHRAVLRLVCNTDYHQVKQGERVLQTGSLAFDASTFELWGPLLNGGCCCLPPGTALLEIQDFDRLLAHYRVDTVFLTTGLFNQIVEFNVDAFRALKTVLTGGEQVSVPHVNRLRRAAPDLRILHVYGPTENTTFSTWFEITGPHVATVPVGGPIANSTVYILDEFMQPVPIGVPGEIYCGGDGVARGYLGYPDLTAERFPPDPFSAVPGRSMYRTGDIAAWDENGNVVFLGRNDDQVKIRGFRVGLGEVEACLKGLAGIENAFVVARKSGGTHELLAYLVPAAGSDRSAEAVRGAMAAKVPACMIPSRIIFVDRFPLNASGKVDRRALPEPVEVKEAARDVVLSGKREECLGAICRSLLGRDRVDRNDNFFRLGGDSIKAIQFMARARQEGIIFKLADVFASATIADLAEKASESPGTDSAAAPEPESPLSPIQAWWLDQAGMPADHFNLATVLRAGTRLDGKRLRACVETLVRLHPALRLSFVRGAGKDTQKIRPEAGPVFEERKIRESGEAALVERRTFFAGLQKRLSLAEGRLVAVGLAHGCGSDHVALIAHHWAADEVTGRVLVGDLAKLYMADDPGRAACGLSEAMPFTNWCHAMSRAVAGGVFNDDIPAWTRIAEQCRNADAWIEGRNRGAERVHASADLDARNTRVLVDRARETYRADIRDMLLVAFGKAWSRLTGHVMCPVAMEGHGREPLPGIGDISRTAGWFTGMFPFLLTVPADDDFRHACRAVKDAVRAIPRRGFSYGALRFRRGADIPAGLACRPHISFNYLGQTRTAENDGLFVTTMESAGPAHDPSVREPFALDVLASVHDDALRLIVEGEGIEGVATPQRLLDAWHDAVLELAEHLAIAEPALSVSDTLAPGLDLKSLDEALKVNGVKHADVETILPLTPLQAGMVYHSITAGDHGAYADQVCLRLHGRVESSRFASAVNTLSACCEGLRTSILHEPLPEPVQAVLRQREIECRMVDAGSWGEDRVARLESLRRENRERGFDLARAGLIRFTLVSFGSDEHELIVDFHHAAIDGWSSGLVLDMLEHLYRDPEFRPALPSLSGYYKWLLGQPREGARAYWEKLIGDYAARTAMPPGRAGLDTRRGEPIFVETAVPAEDVERLSRWAASQESTLNNVVQALWGLLLFHVTGGDDVVFGATVSGRDVPVDGLENLVGMFINTLPVRVKGTRSDSFASVVGRVRRQFADSLSHGAISLADIQSLSPAGGNLLTHTIVFENTPAPSGAGDDSGWRWETVGIYDPMHFEFGVIVSPQEPVQNRGDGRGLTLRFVADGALYSRDRLELIGADFRRLCAGAAADPGASAGSLMESLAMDAERPWTVSATFTADPLLDHLQFWGTAAGRSPHIEIAGFNQVIRNFTDPDSRLARLPRGIHVVLWRPSDWKSNDPDEAMDLLVDGLRDFAGRVPTADVLVVPCPGGTDDLSGCGRLADRLARRMTGIGQVHVIPANGLPDLYDLKDWAIPGDAIAGGIPYTEPFYAALAATLVRWVDGRRRAPVKVFAVDADETLWGGIVGEDGPDGIQIGAPHLALQQFLVDAVAAGQLVCLVTRNNAEDIEAVFAARPDMPLKREHVARVCAGWNAKSDRIRTLAQDLSLGLEGIVLLDDSPVECGEVRSACPGVRVVNLPPHDRERFLRHMWLFDHGEITGEDAARTRMYREDIARRDATVMATGFADFLARLQVNVDIHDMRDTELDRVSQLTRRTNQFNTTSWRMTSAEVAAWAAKPGHGIRTVTVSDRFGEYGLTGVMFVAGRAGSLDVPCMLLSCRVLGRGVEHAMLRHLAGEAVSHGVGMITVDHVPAARNVPAREFLERHGRPEGAGAEKTSFVFSTADALALQPGECPAHAPKVPAPSSRLADNPARDDGRFYETIAGTLVSGDALVSAMHSAFAAGASFFRHTTAGSGGAPRDGVESILAALWKDVLNIATVGRDDHFLALGGHSLKAVMLLSRIRAELGVQLHLEDIHENPVLSRLAAKIAGAEASEQPGLAAGPARDDHPLARGQARLWMLENMRGSGPSPFHMSACLVFDGIVDKDSLDGALDDVIARHESLRTAIRQGPDGQPRQHILPQVSMRAQWLAGEMDEAQFAARMGEFARSAFDLGAPPLMRIVGARLDGNRTGIGVVMHHIVSDGWSLGVLGRELDAFYRARLSGEKTELAPLRVQYRDYAQWQAQCMESPAGRIARSFWMARLSDLPSPLELPADAPRPGVKQTAGAQVTVAIPSSVWRLFCKRMLARGNTSFCALVAGVQLLLTRLSGQGDFIVGTPVAGRTHPDLEGQIGFFVNILPLRAAVNLHEKVETFLDRVGADIRTCLEHQDYSFDLMVDALSLERDMSRAPLFDVLVVLQNVAQDTPRLGDTTGRVVPLESWSSQYDLTFNAFENADGGLHVVVEYDTALFTPERMKRLGNSLQAVFSGFAGSWDIPAGDIPWVADDELAAVRGMEGHAGKRMETTIPDLVAGQAGSFPDKVAVRDSACSLTYAELVDMSRRAAACVSARVERGAAVGVLGPRSSACVAAMLGIMRAGCAYVPLDPANPVDRLAMMIGDGGLAMLIVTDTSTGELAAQLACGRPCLPWSDIVSAPADGNLPMPVPSDVAYTIFTSGSTGRPKGVAVSHAAFCTMITEQIRAFDVHATDVVGQFATPAFDASLSEAGLALARGATLAMAPDEAKEDTDAFLKWLERDKVNILTLPPAFLRALDGADLADVRVLITAGEAADSRWMRHYSRKMTVINAYGPTEAAVCATTYRVVDSDDWPAGVPIGRPLPCAKLTVRDVLGQRVPTGVPGELFIGGPTVAEGYVNSPALTREKFVSLRDDDRGLRWYRTGDRCRWRADGLLEFLGRDDDQVKIRGYRVEPGEIESVLRSLDGVADAAVVLGDCHGLVAFCAVGGKVVEADLVRETTRRLPAYMRPSRIVVVDELPRTSSGKIDRRRLHPPSDAAQRGLEPPEGPAEVALAAAWCEVLGKIHIGRSDDFFRLGGDSIKALRVLSSLRRAGWHGVLRNMFGAPTLREAALGLGRGTGSPNEPATVCGAVEMLPIQKWFLKSRTGIARDQFSLAATIDCRDRVDFDRLKLAVARLLETHDSLRASFIRESGKWKQVIRERLDANEVLTRETWTIAGGKALDAKWERLDKTACRRFNLASDPLLRVVLVGTPASDTIVIVLHHLVADWVSLRVIVGDLATLYDGKRAEPGTHLVSEWAKSRRDMKSAERMCAIRDRAGEAAHVCSALGATAGLHRDAETRHFVVKDCRLSALRGRSRPARDGGIRDILMASAVSAMADVVAPPVVPVIVEGHGREAEVAGMHLGRVVGWLTRASLVILSGKKMPLPDRMSEIVEALGEDRPDGPDVFDLVEHGGGDSLPALVSFNYLGDFDEAPLGDGGFSLGKRVLKHGVAPGARADVPLRVEAYILNGQLDIHAAWTCNAFAAGQMDAWWKAFLATVDC